MAAKADNHDKNCREHDNFYRHKTSEQNTKCKPQKAQWRHIVSTSHGLTRFVYNLSSLYTNDKVSVI